LQEHTFKCLFSFLPPSPTVCVVVLGDWFVGSPSLCCWGDDVMWLYASMSMTIDDLADSSHSS